MKYSPEPWEVRGENRTIIDDRFGSVATTSYSNAKTTEKFANSDRIVACVNACAGIADPAELRAQRDDLLAVCRMLSAIETCDKSVPVGFIEARSAADAAIAKAEGGAE